MDCKKKGIPLRELMAKKQNTLCEFKKLSR